MTIEEEVRTQGFEIVAGIDEAGRGPLAGPITAAACILPVGFTIAGVDDSKKLTGQERYALYREIISHPGVDYGIGVVEAAEIDQLNIHRATLEAMRRAVIRLTKKPDFLLVDGCHVPDLPIPSESIVEGDQKVLAIAVASILAKVIRDHIMLGYDDLFPNYGLRDHKGYGTKKHREAIDKYGPSPIHRMSFGQMKDKKR